MKFLVALCTCVLAVQPATCSEAEALLEDLKIPQTCVFTVMSTAADTSKDEGEQLEPGSLPVGMIDRSTDATKQAMERGNTVEQPTQNLWCRPAAFGDQGTIEQPNGRPGKSYMDKAKPLVIGHSENACDEKVCDDNVCDEKVVLVFRGGCSFYDKAKNVWGSSKGKAAAILVADTQDTNANGLPITMSRGNAGNNKHDIERFLSSPVAAILKETGLELKKWLNEKKHVIVGMDYNKWLDRENEYRLKTEIKDGTGNSSTAWHNLAVSMMNQGQLNEALTAVAYSASLEPTVEIYELQYQMYFNARQSKSSNEYIFKAARSLCQAAAVQREKEKSQNVRPKKSLELRKKAKETFIKTYEGPILAKSAGDINICDMEGLNNATVPSDIFKGKPFAKEMYPQMPELWSDEHRAERNDAAPGPSP
jgi:hypothetical protein